MSRMNDLAGVLKNQVSVLNETIYELLFLKLDEDMAEAYLETMVRSLNDTLAKMDVDPVTSDAVDENGRRIEKG